ncbi:hypothetical protein WM40_23405 [Robbsia andropogonis]|uniref:Uncharacterized protein n=1 Tax=Robbsia andropogonis TaxID=28092 RepID=A0A0F5JU94_9BURK|nr:hypothetical protein WM40_23405 [Robbsia andropogonis]
MMAIRYHWRDLIRSKRADMHCWNFLDLLGMMSDFNVEELADYGLVIHGKRTNQNAQHFFECTDFICWILDNHGVILLAPYLGFNSLHLLLLKPIPIPQRAFHAPTLNV